MEYCKVTKMKNKNTMLVFNLNQKKQMCVMGNLPQLFMGVTIQLELGKKVKSLYIVDDYRLDMTEKNTAVISKYVDDIEEYKKALKRHEVLKEMGYNWKVATMDIPSLYLSMDFGEADRIHKKEINNPTDKERIAAINKLFLENARNKRKIEYGINEYLSMFDELEKQSAYDKIMTSLKMLCLMESDFEFKDFNVIDKKIKADEEFIKENIKERLDTAYPLLNGYEIEEFKKTHTTHLAKEQSEVLNCLVDNMPCVVTGGAGTGKTTVIKSIIDCYSEYYKSSDILLVAPTGKASRRLAEKTNHEASTIHKALRKNPEDKFCYYANFKKLPHQLIIVDESSMIDTELMADLLRATDKSSKLIFAGDHNQLYPVGYGEPFFDFLSSLEVFCLEENHRQKEDTDILKNAENVLADKPLENGKGVLVKDIKQEEIIDILKTVDTDKVQIISPYNEVNGKINAYLKKGTDGLNKNDKIMTMKNTDDYCNGDIGRVIDNKDGHITIGINGKAIPVNREDNKNIVLAYAITVHKMQGSESDEVIVFLPKNDKMKEKRLVYTAVTRARKDLKVYYYE